MKIDFPTTDQIPGLRRLWKQAFADEDEFLEIDRVPFEDLFQQVMDGEIKDAKTVAAVLKTKLLLK